MVSIINPIITENTFWLQIMGDHAIIILNALSPIEKNEIGRVKSFISLFDELLSRARVRDLTTDQINRLNQEAVQATENLKTFKLHILTRQLTQEIKIDIVPGLINHQLNETEEYLNLLNHFIQDKSIFIHPIHLHLVWLIDAIGHANIIMNGINFSSREIIQKAQTFEQEFAILFLRAWEMNGFLRTGQQDFAAFRQLNKDVVTATKQFENFFDNLETQIGDKSVLGSLSLQLLDHMYRENCYYIKKLSQVTSIEEPACDPSSPRKE